MATHRIIMHTPAEHVDVLDCTGQRTGEAIARDMAHRSGTWHGAFHCLIIYQRNGLDYALFQLRSLQKQIAPGKFDVSVGGHTAAGEEVRNAGPREIREELGLDVAFHELVPLGRRVFVYCFPAGVHEYEFQDIFLLSREVKPEALSLQPGEVDAVLELEIEKGLTLFSFREHSVSGRLFREGTPEEPMTVTTGDFVPSVDTYYFKLLSLAQRYFAGQRDVLVI